MLLRVFHRQAPCDGIQTTFRDHRKGSSYAGDWIVDQCGADAHDAAAGLLCLHSFNRKLRDVNETREVGRDERIKVNYMLMGERIDKEKRGGHDDGDDRAEIVATRL